MRKDIIVTGDWSKKIRYALKVNSNIISIFCNREVTNFLIFYSPKMDFTKNHYIENLENQMDKVIRISNSLDKKIISATSNSSDKSDQNDQESNAYKFKNLKIKSILSQNEDLRHIAQKLTLELERSRTTEKSLLSENSKLQQEKEHTSLEISSLKSKEHLLKNSVQEAKKNLDKLEIENETLKKKLNCCLQEQDTLSTAAKKEAQDTCEDPEDKIKNLNVCAESHILTMQNEIDNLKTTLFRQEMEFREKLRIREKEIEEILTKELDSLRNENRKLLSEKENLILQESSVQNEDCKLGRDLEKSKESLEEAKENNEFSKSECNSSLQRAGQSINLKIEEKEIAKRFEEVKSSYDERIRVLQQDFESRRLMMVGEIQRLRTALNDKENKIRFKYEANERQLKDKYKNEIELLTKQYRSLLEEKEKLTYEMCNMKFEERSIEGDKNEKYEEMKTQNEILKNELDSCRQQLEQNRSSNRDVQELVMKLQEMKSSYENLIRNLQRDFESRDLVTKREIEMLKSTLSDKDLELEEKMQRKEKEIHQTFLKRLEALTEDNLALMKEKDKYQQEIDALKNEEGAFFTNIQISDRSIGKFQTEDESLKHNLGTKQRYVDEIIHLNVEKQEKIKELEATRSSYDARISSIVEDFEARRLVMINEIEKLRSLVNEKDMELRQQIEKDKNEKDRAAKCIESLNTELRKQLQEKERVISETCSLRSQEKVLSQKLKDAEQIIEKLHVDCGIMTRELLTVKQQTQHMVTMKFEEEEARKRYDKMRSSYEDRIQALQQDYETRRLIMMNEMEKLRNTLANKDDEIRRQLDEKEREVKENYEKLVECLSNELKRTLTDTKDNEDLIHEKWNAKLIDCREQMSRNIVCLERQIELCTNNATMRTNQLASERDELKSQILILQNELERRRRQFEVEVLEKDKKMDEIEREHQRVMQEMGSLKECIIHKDNMIDLLQETVRKECTEREDILRKLDEIRKSSKISKFDYKGQVTPTSDTNPLEKACVQYVPQSGPHSLKIISSELYGSPIGKSSMPLPAYMKGIPLMLHSNCLSASDGGTPIRSPSTLKLTCNDHDSKISDITKLCVVRGTVPELEFTIGRGKSKKAGKLIRSRSLQTSNTQETTHLNDRDHKA